MPQTFPTLYKKTSSGSLQQWRIWVELKMSCGLIWTEHGQVGGKLQQGSDAVDEGKNLGKKNETSAYEQACLEAQAKWTKKIEREGYVDDLIRAEAGETDVEGGIFPMLAKSLDDVPEKKRCWPYDYQRKFNGIRCLVEINNGAVKLWSRKHKPILGVPHIQKAYEEVFADVSSHHLVLDGEIYRHGWSLQKISGFVRKEKTKPGFEQLGHFVYDFPKNDLNGGIRQWRARKSELGALFSIRIGHEHPNIHMVETISVEHENEARAIEKKWVDDGYEGGILRDIYGEYEPDRRSPGLLKVKSFKDAEYEIVGVKEGRGKFEGKAVFECKTPEGKPFDCCAPGNFEDRAEFFRRGDELIGKLLTVKYFEMTDDNKPCFPVGMAVRDYE